MLAPSQYEQYYGNDFRSSDYAPALQQLRSVVANQTLLFIGFGLSDAYLMGLLKDLFRQFDGNLPPSFAIGVRSEAEAESIWSEFNVQTIHVDDYGSSFRSLLSELSMASQTAESADSASPEDSSAEQSEAHSDYSPQHSYFAVPYRQKGTKVIGRDDAIDELRELLESADSGYGRIASIQGLGGLGKTQLAVEYAYEFADDYPNGVFWFEADNDIHSQLIQLSVEAKWTHPETDSANKLAIATNRIRTLSDALIIFDNVSSIEEIKQYLPRVTADPDILLTAQNEIPGVMPFQLGVLSVSEGVQMLRSESGRDFGDDDEAAIRVVETLSRLPLGVELAGAYLRYRSAITLAEYAEQIESNVTGAVSRASAHFSSFVSHGSDLRLTIHQTEEAVSENEILVEILGVLTWSASAPMGASLLGALVTVPTEELNDALSLGVALRLLEEFESVSTLPKRYRIRRLLAQLKREDSENAVPEDLLKQTVPRLSQWFHHLRLEHEQLPLLESELDHLVAWKSRSDTLPLAEVARLRWLEAYPPYLRGDSQTAADVLDEAATLFEGIPEEDYTNEVLLLKAHIFNDLGAMYGELGARCPEYDQTAFTIRKRILGEWHEDTAMSLSNLAYDVEDPTELETTHRRALEIRKKVLGEKNQWTSMSLRSLSDLALEDGRHSDAIALATEAKEAASGIPGPAFGQALVTLATCLGRNGQHEAAVTTAEEAVAALENTIGPNHQGNRMKFELRGAHLEG